MKVEDGGEEKKKNNNNNEREEGKIILSFSLYKFVYNNNPTTADVGDRHETNLRSKFKMFALFVKNKI